MSIQAAVSRPKLQAISAIASSAGGGGARCPAFDGLRGVGITAVVLHHQGVSGFTHAYIFLDLFFVLSGLLITHLLAREYATHRRISFKAFWQRRLLRITPLYVLYVSILTLGYCLGAFDYAGDATNYLGLLWIYAINLNPSLEEKLGFQGWDISGFLWSLSLEEQFYLVWPFLCLLFLRRPRVGKVLLPLMIALHLVAFRAVETQQGVLMPPWTRGMGMTMGSTAALLLHWYPDLRRWIQRSWVQPVCLVLILGGVVPLSFMTPVPDEYTTIKNYVPPLLFPLTLLCISLWYYRESALSRFLSRQPFLYLGQISYGLYIWHSLAFALTGLVVQLEPEYMYYPELAAALLLAVLSYTYFERPFLRLKDKLSAAPRRPQIQSGTKEGVVEGQARTSTGAGFGAAGVSARADSARLD